MREREQSSGAAARGSEEQLGEVGFHFFKMGKNGLSIIF